METRVHITGTRSQVNSTYRHIFFKTEKLHNVNLTEKGVLGMS